MNSVQLMGRLTRDVEVSKTPTGVSVARFSLAINRNYKNQQGEYDADFINCIIWREAADRFANFFQKGSLVAVEGRIQTGSYENQSGQRVYTTEVVVERFHFTGERRNNDFAGGNAYQGNNNQYHNFQSNQQTNNYSFKNDFNSQTQSPFADFNGAPVDISEDDLPF